MAPADVPAFALPMLAAVLAGGLIGLEREWRGRSAGFRTHILVSLSSALLMQVAVSQDVWLFSTLPGAEIVTDPTRMAHGVLTGIGFLCAGVIFRTGFSVHGLTTAASLWITAALGLTFGAGLYALGATATVIALACLVGLRMVNDALPARDLIEVTVAWRPGEDGTSAEVERIIGDLDGRMQRTRHELTPDGVRRRSYRLKVINADLGALADRLAAAPGVLACSVDPRDG